MSARVDDRGHRSHGSTQMTTPAARVTPAMPRSALRFALGAAGTSGTATATRLPHSRNNTADRRPPNRPFVRSSTDVSSDRRGPHLTRAFAG
jgi:hypothetical protein